MALIPGATPHTLRHTCAKRLIDQGDPITYVSRIMGHENIQTIKRYVLPSEQDLRKAVESISEEKQIHLRGMHNGEGKVEGQKCIYCGGKGKYGGNPHEEEDIEIVDLGEF